MALLRQVQQTDDVAYVFFRGPVIYCAYRGDLTAFRSSKLAIAQLEKYQTILISVSRAHYDILEDLYRRHNAGRQTVYVVSPVSFDAVFPDDIYATMLSSWNYPKSIGGPRPIRYEDYYFAYVHRQLFNNGANYVYPAFCEHILHPYISLLNIADWESLARIVGLIGDPRWYYDQTENQDRTIYRNIMRGLGISLEAAILPNPGVSYTVTPWNFAVSSWFDRDLIPVYGDNYADDRGAVCESCGVVGSFIMRRLLQRWDGEYDTKASMLFYKNTKLFLTFLVDVWLWVEASVESRGYDFPAFSYLSEPEREELVDYLETVGTFLT